MRYNSCMNAHDLFFRFLVKVPTSKDITTSAILPIINCLIIYSVYRITYGIQGRWKAVKILKHDKLESITPRNGVEPPRAQGQSLQLPCSWLDEHYKSERTNEHTDNVSHIVSVMVDQAGTTAVDTAILLWLEGTREGSGDEGAFE